MATLKKGDPQQIDAKSLGFISDQLNHEALAYKKFMVCAQSFTDPQLKRMAKTTAQHHKQHFSALQKYLESHK